METEGTNAPIPPPLRRGRFDTPDAPMTRERLGPWMKLYADVVDRKAHYTDGQFRALITVFAMAARTDGVLPPAKALRAILGAKRFDFLVAEGDLVAGPDSEGTIFIPAGWSIYQRPIDATNAERQKRFRERQSGESNAVTSPVSHDGGNGVTVTALPLSASVSVTSYVDTSEKTTTPPAPAPEDGVDAKADPADAYWQITGRWPNDKALNWIDDLTQQYGAMPVIRAIAVRHSEDGDTRTLLGRVTDGLKREARQLDMKERDVVRERIDARPVKRRLTQDEKDAAYIRTNQIVARLMAGATDEQIRQEFGGSSL